MFGDNIGFGNAGIVCVFSLIVVFFVLIIISYLIDFVAALLKKDKKAESGTGKGKSAAVEPVSKNGIITQDTEDNQRLAAIITAAAVAFTGVSSNNLVVRKITRLPASDSAWGQMARQEYISK